MTAVKAYICQFALLIFMLINIGVLNAQNIKDAEYFWDTDPGVGNATPMSAIDGAFNDITEAVRDLAAQPPASVGPHSLNVRVQDSKGSWGPTFSVVVAVDEANSISRSVKVTMAEAFFNADPGVGNGTAMLAIDGNFNEALEAIMGGGIPGPVNSGVNLLSIRVMDAEGVWGPVFSVVVNMDTSINACSDTLVTIDSTVCFGTVVYGYSNSGSFVDTFNISGCDSIRTLNLTVIPQDTVIVTTMVCTGDTVEEYFATGVYYDAFPGSDGCDSIRVLDLTVNQPTSIVRDTTICFGESYFGYDSTGVYMDTFVDHNSCIGSITTTLVVLPSSGTTIDSTVCFGQSVFGYQQSGTYMDTLTSSVGCDSVRTLNLTVLPDYSYTLSTSICTGDTLEGYFQSGTYMDTFNVNGCDSIRTLNLTVVNAITQTVDKTICDGDIFEGYDSSGTYVDTFQAVGGCDSIRTLNLLVEGVLVVIADAYICEGDSILAGGAYQTTAGTFYDTLLSMNGCDSVVVETAVAVFAGDTISIDRNNNILSVPDVYNSYTWYQDGALVVGATGHSIAVTANGTYSVEVVDSNGCEIEVSDLMVLNLGIEKVRATGLLLYPNPFEQSATVVLPLSNKLFQIRLLDVSGKEVRQVNNVTGVIYQLKRSGLSAGIYFLELTAEEVYRVKLVIQ